MFEDFDRFYREMDRMLGRFYGSENLLGWDKGLTQVNRGYRAPMCDVRETEKSVIADVELPGAAKEDIDLNVKDDEVEVKVDRRKETEKEEEGRYSYVAARSSYYRRIPLPAEVDAEKSTADYKDGILHIEMPKSENASSKTKVNIS